MSAGKRIKLKTLKSQIPAVILKAFDDSFDYEIGLRSGNRIRFCVAAEIKKGWIQIDGICEFDGREVRGPRFDRGMEIRIADIVWAVDAPHGS